MHGDAGLLRGILVGPGTNGATVGAAGTAGTADAACFWALVGSEARVAFGTVGPCCGAWCFCSTLPVSSTHDEAPAYTVRDCHYGACQATPLLPCKRSAATGKAQYCLIVIVYTLQI